MKNSLSPDRVGSRYQFRHWDKKILKKILNTMVKTKDNLKVKNVSKVKGEGTEEQKSR